MRRLLNKHSMRSMEDEKRQTVKKALMKENRPIPLYRPLIQTTLDALSERPLNFQISRPISKSEILQVILPAVYGSKKTGVIFSKKKYPVSKKMDQPDFYR